MKRSEAVTLQPIVLPTVRDPALPTAFDAWFQRACARDRAQRFSNAMELADSLRAAFSHPARVAGPPTSADASGRASAPPVRRPTTGGGISNAVPPPATPASRARWIVPAAGVAVAIVGASIGVIYAVSRAEPTANSEGARATSRDRDPPPRRKRLPA